jgi:hypothetical protein
MKKPFTQRLAIFLCALLMSVPARSDDLEKAKDWVRHQMLEASDADGCAYSEWLSRYSIYYVELVRNWNGGSAVSFSAQTPSHYLDFLDASLEACSLSAGKSIPDPDTSKNEWLERFDARFNHADALALAGPSVKDWVTRYWQRNGKTHIRFALNTRANALRSWAKRRGIVLQLARQKTDGPVYNRDPIILRGKTAIPVFVVSPDGLAPAHIVDFAVVGDSCQGGDWVEVVLENDATPPVWAVIALRDPGLAKNAKVTRQRQLETQKEGTHYLELKRGVLRLEFENDALPPLILVARQLGFWERNLEMGEKEDDWIETEKTLRGSVWGTEILIPDEAYTKQQSKWNPSAVFGRPISFLGSPRCPPPAPE